MEGTPFGRYRLQHLIGRGGMGEVWRAFDTETQRVVAIKLLPAQMATDAEFIERFRREARVAAGLNSPNVVPIHNFGEIDGQLYVDMALIDGRDLQAVLDEGGPMHPERAVRVIEQVAAALRAAHAAGLVHRDVKPSNILLNADDFAYLIDFGLARTDEDAGLTVTGHTVGTFAYMAPERYEGRAVDARTDVYSLACVLYQCLTGKRPFAGSGAQQMLAHIQTPPPRPTDTAPGLPRGLDAVVATGMAKQVDARYPTIDGFARAARQALAHPGPSVGPATRPWQQPPPPQQPPPQQFRPPQPAGVSPVAPVFSAPPQYGPSSQSVVPRAAAAAPWFRRKPVLVVAACAIISIVAVTAVILTTSSGGGSSAGGGSTTTAAPVEVKWGDQTVLPADELTDLGGITVNNKGAVVGICCAKAANAGGNNAIYNIAADDQTPPKITPIPQFATGPGIATDSAGNGYFAQQNGVVIRVVPQEGFEDTDFPKTDRPAGLAADANDAVYLINRTMAGDPPQYTAEVWKLDKGATEATKLPFNGPSIGYGIAVDKDGTVYVTDPVGQSLQKLAIGDTSPSTVKFPAPPVGVAVDADGAVYAAVRGINGDAVYRLPPGSDKPEKLPITGITLSEDLAGIAVDDTGSVLVADFGNNRIVKLPRVSP